MKKIILIFSVYCSAICVQNSCIAQVSKDSIVDSFVCGRHTIGAGFGKYALYYLNYEYKLVENKWSKTTASFGYAGAPGDEEGKMPSYSNLSIGINQYIGFRPVFLSIGFVPSLNFYGLSYIELNGKLGLQYVFKNCDIPLSIEIGRIFRLYRSHKEDVGPGIYLGFGVNID